jgi:hypothetical protein
MSDIAFPTLTHGAVQVLRWRVIARTQEFRSPFDGTVQTGDTQGPRWGASLDLRRMEEADAVVMQAFLVKLRGKVNRALIQNFGRPVPRGTIALSGVTVNGALAAGATQLTLAGCGDTKTLLTGDFLGVGGQLLMVVDGPYTSDAAGAMANVLFEHPLRAAVSDTAAVTTNTPTGRMVLLAQESDWMVSAPVITQMSLEFEEAMA